MIVSTTLRVPSPHPDSDLELTVVEQLVGVALSRRVYFGRVLLWRDVCPLDAEPPWRQVAMDRASAMVHRLCRSGVQNDDLEQHDWVAWALEEIGRKSTDAPQRRPGAGR